MSFHLTRRKDTGLVSDDSVRESKSWIRLLWITSTLFAGFYLMLVYLLPLLGVVVLPVFSLRGFIEAIICIIPVSSVLLLTVKKVSLQKPLVSVDNTMLLIQIDNHIIGTCCLEIESVSGSVYSDENGKPRYNESMLLAMRAGMDKSVTMAFEAGVENGEPFLYIFITATGNKFVMF